MKPLPCPFCGELPDTQKCGGAPDYYVCCEILAYSLEMWNKCSAAMTYAMAETERESFWSGGICAKPGVVTAAIRRVMAAREQVYEVFK